MNWQNYMTPALQATALAEQVAAQLQTALHARGRATLAVPGGTTPAPFLRALAQHALDWTKVVITLTDERQVPADHERSNARLLRENFLQQGAAAARFLPLFSGESDEAAVQRTAMQLREQCLPLDVCVLGMGTDGHFASLFPGADQLAAGLNLANPAALLAITAADIPEPRLSLSLAAIITAPAVHLLITGEQKQQVLQQATADQQPVPALPVTALLRAAGNQLTVHFAT